MAAISCPTKKRMLETFLAELSAEATAMDARAAVGQPRMETVAGTYNEPPDPNLCCDRAVSAAVAAGEWLEAFRNGYRGAEDTIRTKLATICDYIAWESHASQVESMLENYATFLSTKDQELGSMEALWSQIEGQCPVPRPTAEGGGENTTPGGDD